MTRKYDLRQYSLSASAFLLLSDIASGQVVYNDIVPDAIFELCTDPEEEYIVRDWPLDLNMDGKIDFTLEIYSMSTSGGSSAYYTIEVKINPEEGNAVMNYYYRDKFGAAVIEENKMIGAERNWNDNGQIHLLEFNSGSTSGASSYGIIFTDTDGYWANEEDKFVGFQFLAAGGSTHYGWMRLSLEWEARHDSNIQIKDFAYEESAGKEILTPCIDGCPEPVESIQIFSDGNHVYVNVIEARTDNIFTIRNINGIIIYEGSFYIKEYVFDSDLPAGIYFVTVWHNGQEKTIRIGLIE